MKFTDSLRGYSFESHKRDDFKCVYCGLDGSVSFSNWIRLSQEHLLPKWHDKRDNPEYIVTACRFCNEAENRYFEKADELGLIFDNMSRKELIDQRRPHVDKVRDDYHDFWAKNVTSHSIAINELSHSDKITAIAEMAIKQLKLEFFNDPTQFYTENDLICRLVNLLSTSLGEYGINRIKDSDGNTHQLIHCEYPTPFRCDMRKHNFCVKGEDDRTTRGYKYKRGRFDIVLFNPCFVKRHIYSDVKGQSYEKWKKNVSPLLTSSDPAVLLGIEIIYERNDIKQSRGKNKLAGIDRFVSKIIQDHQKLVAGCNCRGFMKAHKTLAFVKGSETSIRNKIRDRLAKYSSISLIMSNQQS